MSLLSSIGKIAGKVVGVASKVGAVASGGTLGAGLAAATMLAKKKAAPAVRATLPVIQRSLPGVGQVAAGSGLAIAADKVIQGPDGQMYVRRRRRRKGITAKDLQSFKRVARLVDKYSKSVHHFKNFKHK